ncbi:MAG: hypothetical protein KAS23_00240, partial [Anaerohalosphaera sp.]|nr:hypothetical protein [Anaerohalosphaera sp.]
GHVEFVKNMITGASQAEAAILIVDADQGVREQTQRHSYMLSLLGVKQVIAVINKMDLVEYSEQKYIEVKDHLRTFLSSVNIEPALYIPISAIKGDNISKSSEHMGWYDGPCFLGSLDSLRKKPSAEQKSLVFPIQDVYKVGDKRINAGRVEAGTIKNGMDIKILPSGEKTQVKTIEKFLSSPEVAAASESIGMTTADPVFLDRGNIVCTTTDEPVLTDKVQANIFWMSKHPFNAGMKLTFRCATQETGCKIENIIRRINSSNLETIDGDNNIIENLEVARIEIRTKKPVAIKDFNDVQELGRFVLVNDGNICAGGIITLLET